MRYAEVQEKLRACPRSWLVTGAAGFIGSNLVEQLLELDQRVVGLDNFSTGRQRNLHEVRARVSPGAWSRFTMIEGDIRDPTTCQAACEGAEIVLHQAALGSVPRSIANPVATNQSNIDGFLNMLVAARDAGSRRFVFASSSSVYGDHPGLPKVEDRTGRPLSPYAVTKYVNELYARVFYDTYSLETVGLRYFNVFGRRQDPDGAYAAVIPRWIGNLLDGRSCEIYGDGETSRDFCYIDNVLQANLLAATAPAAEVAGEIFNVAYSEGTTLNQLFSLLRNELSRHCPEVASARPLYREFRPGDIRHSEADIGKARERLGYTPTHGVREGLESAIEWYVRDHGQGQAQRA
jgi:UDP-N-acetylglucosamine 4-epimerase